MHAEVLLAPPALTTLFVVTCRLTQQALLTAPWPATILAHPRAAVASSSGRPLSQEHSKHLLPHDVLFRGLRVRMGIAAGVVEHSSVHEVTKRTEYAGKVPELVSVSSLPLGLSTPISVCLSKPVTEKMATTSNRGCHVNCKQCPWPCPAGQGCV